MGVATLRRTALLIQIDGTLDQDRRDAWSTSAIGCGSDRARFRSGYSAGTYRQDAQIGEPDPD